MIWQDIFITFGSILLSIALIPQIIEGYKEKKGFITHGTTVPTFIGLYLISIAFYTLSFYLSSIVYYISGSLWLILFTQRLVYEKA